MEEEDNYLNCNFCSEKFNLNDRSPRMLPQCGHSICEICLLEYLDIKIPIRCYIDDIITKTEEKIESDFPINDSLKELISKNLDENERSSDEEENNMIIIQSNEEDEESFEEDSNSFEDKNEQSFEENNNNVSFNDEEKICNKKKQINLSEEEELSESEVDNFSDSEKSSENLNPNDNILKNDSIFRDKMNLNQIEYPKELMETKQSNWEINLEKNNQKNIDISIKSSSEKFESVKQSIDESNENSEDDSDLEDDDRVCRLHEKELELICVNCTIRICYQCGLFGEHKHHNVKTEEEFCKDVSDYQMEITKSLKKIGKEENYLKNKFVEKCFELQSSKKLNDINLKITDAYDKIISKLKKQKEKLLESSNKSFKDTGKLIKEEIQVELEKIDEKTALNVKRELMSLLKQISKGEEDETFLYRIMNEKENLGIIKKSNLILETIKSKTRYFQKKVNSFVNNTDAVIFKNINYDIVQLKIHDFKNISLLDSLKSNLSEDDILEENDDIFESPFFDNFNNHHQVLKKENHQRKSFLPTNTRTSFINHSSSNFINLSKDEYSHNKTPPTNPRFTVGGNNTFSNSFSENANHRMNRVNSYSGIRGNFKNNLSNQQKNMNSMNSISHINLNIPNNNLKINNFKLPSNEESILNHNKIYNNNHPNFSRMTPPNDTIIKSPADASFIKKINKKNHEDTIIKKKKKRKKSKIPKKKKKNFDFLKKKKNIETLDLSDINIKDKYINNLFLLLNDSPNLKILILKNIKISDDGVRTLCNHLLERKIENLDLSSNKLKNNSVTYLKQLADANKNLKTITFKDNLVTQVKIQKKIIDEFKQIGVSFNFK